MHVGGCFVSRGEADDGDCLRLGPSGSGLGRFIVDAFVLGLSAVDEFFEVFFSRDAFLRRYGAGFYDNYVGVVEMFFDDLLDVVVVVSLRVVDPRVIVRVVNAFRRV